MSTSVPRSPLKFRALAITALFAIDLVGGLFLMDRATGCVTLNVVSSEEKFPLLTGLADAWVATLPVVDRQCVRVTVHRVASGNAETALAAGATTDGVHPDIWTPAATSWTDLLRQHRAESGQPDILPAKLPRLAQSPLVIAMPQPMARAMGWPATKIGWTDIFALARDPAGWGRYGAAEWGAFRLGKTNPLISTSGLHALVATYQAATHGLSGDLTAPDLAKPAVVDFARGVEESVVHYGPTVSVFTQNLKEANNLTYISAIAAEEQEVWDFNRTSSGIKLAAIYPAEGTLMADHPLAVLNAPWVTTVKHNAAGAFLGFLGSAYAQGQFQAAGFRDREGKPGSELTRRPGLNAAPPRLIATPPPAVLELIQASWQQIRKRARVLLLIDVSPSMAGPNLDLVKIAAAAALDKFTNDDQVGLWEFAGGLGAAPYRELVPIAPVGTSKQKLVEQIRDLNTVPGGTPLYATLRLATAEMRKSIDPGRINAVLVLTVGFNEDPADNDVDSLLASLGAQSAAASVRVFTIGYGRNPNSDTLRKVATTTRAAYYDASDPALIGDIFIRVVSNF